MTETLCYSMKHMSVCVSMHWLLSLCVFLHGTLSCPDISTTAVNQVSPLNWVVVTHGLRLYVVCGLCV